jgi:hypothetical protein
MDEVEHVLTGRERGSAATVARHFGDVGDVDIENEIISCLGHFFFLVFSREEREHFFYTGGPTALTFRGSR